MNKKYLLFNPVSLVHYRNMKFFDEIKKTHNVRIIINPRLPWYVGKKDFDYECVFFDNNRVPERAFKDVEAVVLFTAQPRVPSCHLIQEAFFRSIPVVAVQEVYQMMLEQGYVSEYSVPVCRLFAASYYERERFLEAGYPKETVEASGYMFDRKTDYSKDPEKKTEIKKRLGIQEDKPVAVVILAYLTQIFETLEVRKGMLDIISKGLPSSYEIIIKPHPAESDKNIEYIKTLVPRAKIADKSCSIHDVLEITDVLFTRGNSHVAIQSLEREIPIISVPVGRKIFLHGCLEEVIANNPEDVAKALDFINKNGFSKYRDILKKYIAISPEEAKKNIISGINLVISERKTFNIKDYLLRIGIFWAWMGYIGEAKRSLRRVLRLFPEKREKIDKILRLISCNADYSDLEFFKSWFGDSYMFSIVQSLWIRKLYLKGGKIEEKDEEWLKYFPPRMNKETYMMYVYMLCWCYIRSGMKEKGELLFENLKKEYGDSKPLRRIEILLRKGNKYNYWLKYWNQKIRYIGYVRLKDFIFAAGIPTESIL